jgi:hypothetical protein
MTDSADALAEACAELAAAKAREALALGCLQDLRLRCDRADATLRLLVGFLGAADEQDGTYLLFRLARNLRICAERTDLAAQMAICDESHIDPAIIAAAASVIYAEDRTAPSAAAERAAPEMRVH